jgi:membrane protein implicated in regulation of membrane protease activity
MATVVFALSTGRYIAVGIAAVLLLILVLAFVAYTRRARREDDLRRAAERAGRSAKVCPDCASEVRLDAPACPHCGYRFD